jgi:hypothetical protein
VLGESCGGFTGNTVQCEPALVCETDPTKPDQPGKCVAD